MTERERRLEAPHRRLEPGSRLLERSAVLGYRSVAWVVAHVPPAIPRFVIARFAQLSYLLWPSKRRWSNANFANVLGLPPSDRRVRLTALAAYGEYARYVVELMRLPHLQPDEAASLMPGVDLIAFLKSLSCLTLLDIYLPDMESINQRRATSTDPGNAARASWSP